MSGSGHCRTAKLLTPMWIGTAIFHNFSSTGSSNTVEPTRLYILQMDDIVRQAMRKWPNVPSCCDWLGLDARGEFWMRDEAVQRLGSFQDGCRKSSPAIKGSRVDHVALKAFMCRNYQPDADGCWYFQNGPQKVYVELDLAPLSGRLDAVDTDLLHLHTGEDERIQSVWVDELGVVYAHVSRGLAVIHPQDMWLLAERLEAGAWVEHTCQQAEVPTRFGFVRSPSRHYKAPAE